MLLAYGAIESVVMYVVDVATIVSAVVRGRVPALHELREERARLLTVDDAGERGVLTQQTHAGVAHHDVQEAGLARREPELRDRRDALFRIQPSNSSASPPLRPPLLPPPPRPPIRALNPRYAVKPDRAAAAPCDPR